MSDQPESAPQDPTEAEEGAAEDVPMNRAERRAKGKNKTQGQSRGQQFVPKGNQGQGPRIWANRRAG